MPKYPTITRGNKAILRMCLKADGVPIDVLGSAVSGRFVAIDKNGGGEVIIDKALADMQIDTPVLGTVSIDLTSDDTDITEGTYDIAIEFSWGPGDTLEWNFVEPLNIVRGVIPLT